MADKNSKNALMHAASRLLGGPRHRISNLLSRVRKRGRSETTYVVALPEAFGVARAVVRLSIPAMPKGEIYSFSEHAGGKDGNDTIVACARGGFAYSNDLGQSWSRVKLGKFARFPFVLSRLLPDGEILLLAMAPGRAETEQSYRLLVADMKGAVRHAAKLPGARWHGPRSIDVNSGTLMYAEYPWNSAGSDYDPAVHKPSRVWRSRDWGRSWQAVYEQKNVRHFHYLQARPGVDGEWWLTSGDAPEESRIWKSNDDGDTWIDQTDGTGSSPVIGNYRFPRSLFRLTDLAWAGDEIVWGSDDTLNGTVDVAGSPARGSRVFRVNPSAGIAPTVLGLCGPEVRNIVDVGKFYVLITQSSRNFANDKPQVFLLSKRTDHPVLVRLFEIERFKSGRTGFTQSIASRRANNGVFFTFRNATDVFNAPDRILRWQFEFE